MGRWKVCRMNGLANIEVAQSVLVKTKGASGRAKRRDAMVDFVIGRRGGRCEMVIAIAVEPSKSYLGLTSTAGAIRMKLARQTGERIGCSR